MDSCLKKSKDNGNTLTADDVEAVVKANANTVLANVFVLFLCVNLYELWVPVPCYYFLPFNASHKYTARSAYYFNREESRLFFED